MNTVEQTKENNTQKNELSADLFNLSGEFEDITLAIDTLSGDVSMVVASRRC
ncbi:MAG: hypothetical protein KA116_08470 [Proteobacteria bacterium]|jgi:hypothetical protein|nr:hypothetical protein [Pseudomonadota bacterium]